MNRQEMRQQEERLDQAKKIQGDLGKINEFLRHLQSRDQKFVFVAISSGTYSAVRLDLSEEGLNYISAMVNDKKQKLLVELEAI